LFFFSCSGDPRYLPSFPTRRSSDLACLHPRRPLHGDEPGRDGCQRFSAAQGPIEIVGVVELSRSTSSPLPLSIGWRGEGRGPCRSEERRVGKECRRRGSRERGKKIM